MLHQSETFHPEIPDREQVEEAADRQAAEPDRSDRALRDADAGRAGQREVKGTNTAGVF
jgi:hypothetical protein